MKKSIILLLLGLLVAGNSFAIVDPDPNSLGFYFDTSADVYEIQTVGFLQAYLIIVNPTFDFIKGLECYLDWDESACSYYGMILPPTALNVGDHHNVILGLGTAMATTEATVMATYNFITSNTPVYFSLGAANPPSIGGIYPVVVDGDDNMFQIGMSTAYEDWCAIINDVGGLIVDSQSETWGGVKSLYR